MLLKSSRVGCTAGSYSLISLDSQGLQEGRGSDEASLHGVHVDVKGVLHVPFMLVLALVKHDEAKVFLRMSMSRLIAFCTLMSGWCWPWLSTMLSKPICTMLLSCPLSNMIMPWMTQSLTASLCWPALKLSKSKMGSAGLDGAFQWS